MSQPITIRKFLPQDRQRLRLISCRTAFLELAPGEVFSDDEILADALTLYHTNYEPESCFVAECDNKVVGYIIGTTNAASMEKTSSKEIIPHLFWKALRRGVFFKIVNLKFLFYCLRSACKGEFFAPNFSKQYPAMLHINIEQGYRLRGIGEKLLKAFEAYLKERDVIGAHFGAFSESSKDFFVKMGFIILFQGKRSYLKPYSGKDINYYVFGKKF